MSAITLLIDFRVDDHDAFRVAADKLVAISQTEVGTLAYEWFASDDGRRARIIERFENEAAFTVHSASVGPVIEELKATGTFESTDVLGDASEALRQRMTRPNTTLYAPYAGFWR